MNHTDPLTRVDLRKEDFKDETTFRRVTNAVRAALNRDEIQLVSFGEDEDLIVAVVPPDEMKRILYERMLRKLSEKPTLLREIRERLETDEIVE